MSETHPAKIKEHRARHNLSQGQFADRVGVTRFTVIRWENGARIGEKELPAVSKEIGIPAKELRPDLVEKHEEIFGGAQ